MIEEIMHFFKRFVEVKGVKEVKLSESQQKNRVSNILCLCALASSEVKSESREEPEIANIVLSLMKLLGIRGGGPMKKMEISGMLEVLCNFNLWYKLNSVDQFRIIREIKSLVI